MLDPFAQLHRGVDHQRVEQQDQQCQFPVHPHQNARRTDQGQHGHEETTEGFTDEFVQRVQVGDQMRGHRAAAQAFVFAQGDTLETLDQAYANAVDDVLGQPGEQFRLHHVEQQRRTPQGQGHQQHQANVARGLLPAFRQRVVHDLQRGITVPQQHLVHQQRQEQGNRHAAQGRQHGHAVGDPQGFLVMQGQAADFRPAQTVDTFSGCDIIRQVMHRQHAPASGRAAGTTRSTADSHWSTTPVGRYARPAGWGNRQCPGPGPR
ncbi:hypothetical protein D3C80_813180 [compost metagenome]